MSTDESTPAVHPEASPAASPEAADASAEGESAATSALEPPAVREDTPTEVEAEPKLSSALLPAEDETLEASESAAAAAALASTLPAASEPSADGGGPPEVEAAQQASSATESATAVAGVEDRPASDKPKEGGEVLEPYKRARIHGLEAEKAKHFNGQECVIESWDAASGKWLVQLSSGQKARLSSANLEALPLSPGSVIVSMPSTSSIAKVPEAVDGTVASESSDDEFALASAMRCLQDMPGALPDETMKDGSDECDVSRDSGRAVKLDGSWHWIMRDNSHFAREQRRSLANLTAMAIVKRGYRKGSSVQQLVRVEEMLSGTRVVAPSLQTLELPESRGKFSDTEVTRHQHDVLTVAKSLLDKYGDDQVGLVSAASAYHCGGGFETGGRHALEESLCIQSTLFASLRQVQRGHAMPYLPVDGVVASPCVEVFRGETSEGYPFLDKPFLLSAVISVAMFNRNCALRDGPVDSPEDVGEYVAGVRVKFRSMLAAAVQNSCHALVVPDVGCGVFMNDPVRIGRILGQMLREEFFGHFKEVALCGRSAFQEACAMAFRPGAPGDAARLVNLECHIDGWDAEVWERDLWSDLSHLRKRVTALGANMRFAPSAEDLRGMVTAVERKLQLYAEQARQNFDELAAQEYSLDESLQASLSRFESWCSQESALKPGARATSSSAPKRRAEALAPSGSQSRLSGAGRARPSSASGVRAVPAKETDAKMMEIRERLEELGRKLDAGGPMDGWSSDDHEAFNRLLNGKFRRRATPEFLLEVEQLLPHQSHEALVAHAKWLVDQESFQAERKQLLEEWRGLKEAGRPKTASEVPPRGVSAAQEAQEERQRLAEMKQQEILQQAERRRQVEEWKKQKEEQKEQEQSRRRAQLEAQAREARAKRLQREEKKQEVEAYRRQRQEEEAKQRDASQAAEIAAQRRLSIEDKERIAQRNEVLLRQREVQRRLQEERRGAAAQSFEPPSREAGGAFSHVQSRLQSHTDAYVGRSRELQAAEDEAKAAAASKYGVVPGNFAHQGVMRTVRSSPSWRPSFGT